MVVCVNVGQKVEMKMLEGNGRYGSGGSCAFVVKWAVQSLWVVVVLVRIF